LRDTKRLGRYCLTTKDNTDRFPLYFQQLISFYKDNLGSDKPLLFKSRHDSLKKVLIRADRKIEKSTNFINKIKSREVSCVNRCKSIPENATMRRVYGVAFPLLGSSFPVSLHP
jgi:hypothetical protein